MVKVTKSVPIALIAGYLGAGKTTLLNNILKDPHGHKVAVIVNDIGEVNIDADLIAKGGTVQQQDNSLVPLSNGCICCTLQTDLMDQIAQLCAANTFDYILIEASGICEPLPIAQTIMQMGEICRQRNIPEICHLDNIISVADTLRLAQEFNCGVDFEANRHEYEEEENIASLIIQQIEFSNIVVMNKAELVSEENKAKIKKVIHALAPAAKIVEATYGNVDIDELLDTNFFDFEKNYYSLGWVKAIEEDAKEKEEKKHHHDEDEHEHHHHHDDDDDEDEHEHHHHHDHDDDDDEHEHHHHHDDDDDEDEHEHHHHHDHDDDDDEHEHHHGHHHHHHHHHSGEGEALEYGIDTFVYQSRRPFVKYKLAEVANAWPKSIIRTKGFMWMDEDPDYLYVFEQAGTQIVLTPDGMWLAACEPEIQEREMARDPKIIENWDKTYGDRENKLVFIGHNMDKEKIIRMMDNCLGE